MNKIKTEITSLFPLKTISFEEANLSGIDFDYKGLSVKIQEFKPELKKEIFGIDVYKNGSIYYQTKQKADKHLRESVQSHHYLKLKSYPTNNFLDNLKTFEFKRFVTKLILLNYDSCPQTIFEIHEKAPKPIWSQFISHYKYSNLKFVKLQEESNKVLSKLLLKGFKNYSDNRMHSLLEMFEITKLYYNSNGLRYSLYVTMLESFYVNERNNKSKYFSERLFLRIFNLDLFKGLMNHDG
jgi:hypothetical protein